VIHKNLSQSLTPTLAGVDLSSYCAQFEDLEDGICFCRFEDFERERPKKKDSCFYFCFSHKDEEIKKKAQREDFFSFSEFELLSVWNQVKNWSQDQKKSKFEFETLVYKNLSFILKKFERQILEIPGHYRHMKKEFDKLHIQVQKVVTFEDLREQIQSLLRSSAYIKSIEYPYEGGDTLDVYPIPLSGNKNHYVKMILTEESESIEALIIVPLIHIFENFEIRNNYLVQIAAQTRQWASILDNIPYPSILFDKKSEVIYTNPSFASLDLPLDAFLKSKGKGEVQVEERRYKVLKKEIQGREKFDFYVLLEFDDNIMAMDMHHLSIITGSVAHEINNPLSGILGAVEVLALEEKDEEYNKILKEIKNSSLRSKELVHTFLGFKELTLKDRNEQDIKESLKQAMQMIQSRVLESQIILDLETDCLDDKRKWGSPLMTIILYLTFNELITAFSHFMLLSFDGENSENRIHLNVSSYSSSLNIDIEEEFDYRSQLKENRLLTYLLKISHMEISFEGRRLRLNRREQ
jgi:PAS domain-containing protein